MHHHFLTWYNILKRTENDDVFIGDIIKGIKYFFKIINNNIFKRHY